MKKSILLLLLTGFMGISSLFAQSSEVTIFSNSGEQFTVILDGVKQNPTPETNVKLTGLDRPVYKVKIIFADTKLDNIDKTIYLRQPVELTMKIKQNRKGKYVLRRQSVVSIGAPPTMPTAITDGGMPHPQPQPQDQMQELTATLSDGGIELSDGRVISVSYKKLMFPYPYVQMLQPAGAKVVISYDGKEAYRSEVPFMWKKAKINQYMKLDVTEPAAHWSIKLKPKTGYQMNIGQ